MSAVRLPVDLRSDTLTQPTPAMRAAMAAAEVGDDVLGDGPTVNRLQDVAAERAGCEAAPVTPSGSMASPIAVALHCRPGDGVVAEGAAGLPGVELDPAAVETDIVMFSPPGRSARALVAPLAERGVLAVPAAAEQVTFVTHRDVDDAQIEHALVAVRQVIESQDS